MTAKKHIATLIKSALPLIICTAVSTSYGQVYKKVDENGNVTFSDQPDPEAVTVEVREPNRSVAVEPRPKPEELPPSQQKATYNDLTITHPTDGSVIPNGLVPLPISISLTPTLHQDHQLQLLLDGQVHSENKSGAFTLPQVPRGAHTLQVRIVDDSKNTIKQSTIVSIQVYRPGG